MAGIELGLEPASTTPDEAVDVGDPEAEEATADRQPDAPTWRGLAPKLVPFAPVLLLAWQGWERRWITDDGFINFRVVDMVLAGHGPVFNVGERVEATTSALWLWVLVVGDVLLPFKLEWVAVFIGLGLTLLGLALAIDASVRLWRGVGTSTLLLPAGGFVLAVLPPIWDFTTSGLEGGLTFAWIGAVAWMLARWATRTDDHRLGIPSALLLGLGPLIRPDMALVSGVALVGVLAAQWRGQGWWSRLRLVAVAASIPFAYEIFRMGYYAAVVPNTALAKAAGRSRWEAGWFYLRDLVDTYWLWLPLLLVVGLVGAPLLWRARGKPRLLVAVGALPLAGLLSTLYVVRVGGDYMHGRLLLPAVWAILAPLAVAPLPHLRFASNWLRRDVAAADVAGLARWAGVAVLGVWVLACAGWLRAPDFRLGGGILVADGRASHARATGIEHPVTAAVQHYGPNSPLVNLPEAQVFVEGQPADVNPPDDLRTPAYTAYGVGIIGYSLGPDYYIIDLLGLADPIESRMIVERPGQPGHEKPMPRVWVAARISDGPLSQAVRRQLPVPALVAQIYSTAAEDFDDEAAAARRVLDCPQVQELLDAVREPMTPGRFFDNLLAAPRLSRLEIPVSPLEAERELC